VRGAGQISARDLAIALAIAAIGALGAWPGARGEPDPVALLVWLALIAPACGFACGALQLRPWPAAAVVPATWMFLVGVVDALAQSRDLPRPVWAGCAIAGLFAVGFGFGSLFTASLWRGIGLALLLTALLCALPLCGGFLRTPPTARITARMLDLSPATLVAECAGVDWMRHPAVYDAASTSDIDPTLRSPYDGRLAGGLVFVVGCALAWTLGRVARKQPRKQHGIPDPWPSTDTSAPSPRS
jgi:hypothetical protein